MKTPRLSQKLIAAIIASAGTSLLPLASYATSDAWTGSTSGLWATSSNWATAPATVPGTGDIATFNAASGNTTLDLGSGVTIGSVIFDTSSAAYTIGSGAVGSQSLTLNDTGAVTVNASVTNNQLFNANIVLGTAITGITTITNSSTTNSLTFAGSIAGGTGGTAAAKTINIAGAGAVNFTGSFSAGGATGINVANTGLGVTTLSGSGTSNLLTLRATLAGGKVVVDGQTVNVANASTYTGTAGFDILSGAVNFNGGLSQTSTSADGGLWKVSGGAFSASTITIARNGNPTLSAAVTSGSGLVATGGTANITGIFALGTSNSGSTSLVNGGALAVGGEVRIAAGTSTNRWNILEVRSGSLTSTEATNGIVLSRAGTFAQNAQLLLTGGTTTAEKITFGTGSTFAGSTGVVLLNGSTASLYLGSGGLVSGGGVNITSTINLTSGTLGAKADWSSALGLNLTGLANGSAVSIKAADASNVARNITLSGVLAGTGGFTKTGNGTLTLSTANTYTGTTIVNAGTLALGTSSAIANGNAITLGGGKLDLGGFSQTLGALALTSATTSIIDFGAGASILQFSTISGTGSLNIANLTSGSDSLRFLTDPTAFLAQLTVNGSAAIATNAGSYWEITAASAIPEPSTYVAIAGALVLGVAVLRRRRRA